MSRNAPEQVLGEELATLGLRPTRQRVWVLDHLRRQRRHPTASEIHRDILKRHPRMSLKTVYTVLDSLVNIGLASCISEGGEPARYEAMREPHYHARCRVCGRLYDVDASSDRHIRKHTRLPMGFEVEGISVTVVGRCPRCRARG